MSDPFRRLASKQGWLVPEYDISGMTYPVRCNHCSGVYDLSKVTVTARYTDCSMWQSPCCGREVDDRGVSGGKASRDYEYLGSSSC